MNHDWREPEFFMTYLLVSIGFLIHVVIPLCLALYKYVKGRFRFEV